MVQHDQMLKPIVPPKYDVGFVVENCDYNMLNELEPWCSKIYADTFVEDYINKEQSDTQFDLSKRISPIDSDKTNDIIIRFDAQKLTPQNFQIIVNLSEMLKDSGEVGEMEYDIFKINIKSLKTYEKELIVCSK